jgi:peroxiredoxin
MIGGEKARMSARLPSRRLLLHASLAALAGPGIARERPPVFRTSRYQFRELEPVQTMAPLRLQRLDGKPGVLAPVPGKVCLVYLWATWCPVCRIELPRFERQRGALRAAGVELLTVSTDERERGAVARYLARIGAAGLPVFLDPAGRGITAPYAGGESSPFTLAEGQPVTYAVDRQGGVRGYLLGEADWMSADALALLRALGAS